MFQIFIHRPVLSVVISIIILLLGSIAMTQLPMTQFPSIAPPEVNVTTEYTGANAEGVTKAVITPLERAINGVPGMKYISSDAGNDGVGVVQILFEVGTDPDVAAVNVQNRVATVMPELPAEVAKNGVKIAKEENSMLMYLNIFSADTSLEERFIYNFAEINVLPELKRVKGVGYASLMGSRQYAMRIWLKPDRLLAYKLSPADVVEALQSQNLEASPGKIGESSDKFPQALQFVLKYPGKFNKEEDYANVVLKSNPDGEILRVKDVAEVEFGTTYYDVVSKQNGRPSAAIMIKQLPGSNASEVIDQLKTRLAELKTTAFPTGMDYQVSYDVSRFLDASVHEVVRTLIEAFLLVALVVFLFLQDWRSTLIPALAVPVSLVGTFFFMQFFGFTINLITLFALVLAIGIVVDNAIVVVEAVHAKMEEEHLSPKAATEAAMKDISGAIIAITLVMSAVFIPVAFMSGPTGIFYRQFSVTMAISIVLSGIVALTLTPALCALLLRNTHGKAKSKHLLNRFLDGFNRWYESLSSRYQKILALIVNRRLVTILVLFAFCFGTWQLNRFIPSGFIPNDDQGTFYASITTPSGSTLERTSEVVNAIQKQASRIESIESVSSLAGINVLSDGTGATYGTCLINLKDWASRTQSVDEVMEELATRTRNIKDAKIEYFPPPAVPGYGNASGFELRLLDKTGRGDYKELERVNKQFMADLVARPEIENCFTIFDASFPQYMLHIDYDQAAKKEVKVDEALATLGTLIGSEYATNFIRFNQMYKVMVQALPQYRSQPEDILKLFVKNEQGEMVPFSAFMRMEKVYGLEQVTRYNLFPSAELNGEASPGYSSGSAIAAIQEVAKTKLPRGFAIDWAGISRDEVAAGNQAIYIFLICLLFVYLLLSAQYESFLLPLPVILSLPTGIFGAFFLLLAMGLENNIYAQVAMVMLIGLLGKNAILIVEFAVHRQRQGKEVVEAVIEASVARLRPILMTSFAFIAGLIPLVLASGAGAVGNRTIGSAAAGGMFFGTVFGVLVIPGLYILFSRGKRQQGGPPVDHHPTVTALAGLLLLVMTGCKVPASFPAPEVKRLPGTFRTAIDSTNSALLPKDRFFSDPDLRALIDTALAQNPDLLITWQRMEMARAEVQETKGALLPTGGAAVVPALRRYGLYTMDGAGNITTEITPGKIVPINLPDYYFGLQSTWEADISGKLRSRKRAALARYLAQTEGRNAVITGLVAEVAHAYYELLALDNELEIVRENIRLQQNGLDILRIQKQAGAANELGVKQFEAQVANSSAMEREVLQRRVETENLMNFLLGRFPQAITRQSTKLTNETPATLSAGIPSQLLRNRPDIRQAEWEVQASKFDVRAAKAAFYPSVVLSAGIGFQAFDPAYLLNAPQSLAYSLVGGLTAPLVNRSAIKAQFRAANAAQVEAMALYQKTILNGFAEVVNELSRIDNLKEIQRLKATESQALLASVEISNELFKTGNATYLEVLIAQQNALRSRLELVDTQKRQFQAGVQLYRALGGGWK